MRTGAKILVVDDEPVIRNAVRQLLEHYGCNVVAVDGGQAALDCLAERPFDLVITDFSMPGMPGDELAANIRRLPLQPRILMVTAFADEFRLFDRGTGTIDGLLLKPFTFRELRDAIEAVLDLDEPTDLRGMAASGDLSRPSPDQQIPH